MSTATPVAFEEGRAERGAERPAQVRTARHMATRVRGRKRTARAIE
jgi:hypothetical protein